MKKTLAIGLLICLFAAPAFAERHQPQQKRERPIDRIAKIIKALMPVKSLGPEIVVPWPG
ncbi:MAG TPA: hypothetical protein VGF48_15695 [Thermoanaerobaculia bacterium]|jgi:hypothetical protein